MKKLLTMLACLVALLAACSKSESIPIGFVGSMTGKNGDLGVAARDAVVLAVEEVNASGGIHGRKVALLDRDDAQDPQIAARAVNELIGANVAAIVGHTASSMTKASLPLINASKVVMVSPTASSNELSGRDDYFFRVMEPNLLFARHQAESCMKMGIRRIAVIYDVQNKPYTVDMFGEFKKEFTRLGGVVTKDISYDSAAHPSFYPLVRQLGLAGTGGVMVLANTVDSLTIAQQVRKLSPGIPIISGACGIAQRDLLQQAGKSVDNIVFTLPVDNRSTSPEFLRFKERFLKRFNYEPTFAATLAYDAVQLIFTALRADPDTAKLRETIKGIRSFPGIQGEVTLDMYGDPGRNLFVTRYRQGREEVVR